MALYNLIVLMCR